MKKNITLAFLIFFSFSCSNKRKSPESEGPKIVLETLAEFKGVQVTGVSVSESGRIFACFPRWREDLPYSVVEVSQQGKITPYPNKEWNTWTGRPRSGSFTSVQSVIAHKQSLFVLDPSSPLLKGVVGSAALFEFDLATNKLKRSWTFDKHIAPVKSYLNDLRIDDELQKIYITDSGLGGIIVLDMITGSARRVLGNDPSVKAEPITLNISGKKFLIDGRPPEIHSDGIAYDVKSKMIYYHALTGKTLYRVPAKRLDGQHVENLGPTPATDGMILDKKNFLYMADLENHSIVYRRPGGEIKTLIHDKRIGWADTFAIDQKNNLLFTDSRLNEVTPGMNVSKLKFRIYKVPLPDK